MAFSHAIHALADPGDEIILPAPYYFNHHMALSQAGLRPVTVPTRPDYQLDLAAIEQAITPRTRAIVTVSPNNPTGAVYPEQDLRSISDLCRKYLLTHISDEAYEYFAWLPNQHFSPASIPDAQTRTISIFSLSKSYGMAGWRMGYMLVPDSLKDSMRKIQDTQLICPPVLSQMAAAAALERGRSWPDHFQSTIHHSQQAIQKVLNDWPQLCSGSNPQGAFYFLVRFHLHMSPEDLVKQWIENFRIAVLPASTFGATGCTVRLSYGAIRPDTLAEVIHRLTSALESSANHPLVGIPSSTSP
jgi:aspartate/methionine/tyrosine aminotransferase